MEDIDSVQTQCTTHYVSQSSYREPRPHPPLYLHQGNSFMINSFFFQEIINHHYVFPPEGKGTF